MHKHMNKNLLQQLFSRQLHA